MNNLTYKILKKMIDSLPKYNLNHTKELTLEETKELLSILDKGKNENKS